MPVLANARHERFAQELAKGQSQTDAYIAAGYKGTEQAARTSASTLLTKPNVSARVEEIKQAGAARAEISVERLNRDLVRIGEKAEALKVAPGLAVARAAVMDLAKLNKLIVERSELSGPNGGAIKHDLSGLTDEQLAQLRSILAATSPVARGGGGRDTSTGGQA